jgi:hypothetical protein
MAISSAPYLHRRAADIAPGKPGKKEREVQDGYRGRGGRSGLGRRISPPAAATGETPSDGVLMARGRSSSEVVIFDREGEHFERTAGRTRQMAIAGESCCTSQSANAYGVLLIRTIWETTPDLEDGHRRTDIESVKTVVALQARLAELVGGLVRGVWSIPPLVDAAAGRRLNRL